VTGLEREHPVMHKNGRKENKHSGSCQAGCRRAEPRRCWHWGPAELEQLLLADGFVCQGALVWGVRECWFGVSGVFVAGQRGRMRSGQSMGAMAQGGCRVSAGGR